MSLPCNFGCCRAFISVNAIKIETLQRIIPRSSLSCEGIHAMNNSSSQEMCRVVMKPKTSEQGSSCCLLSGLHQAISKAAPKFIIYMYSFFSSFSLFFFFMQKHYQFFFSLRCFKLTVFNTFLLNSKRGVEGKIILSRGKKIIFIHSTGI